MNLNEHQVPLKMDSILSTSSTMQLAALLPVVNSKQQLLALSPNFSIAGSDELLQVLQQFKNFEFFERLPDVALLLQLKDPSVLPVDLESHVDISRLMLSIPEAACGHADYQEVLHHLLEEGARIFVTDMSSNPHAVWQACKSFAVDCSNGVSFFMKPRLLASGGPHWAKNIGTLTRLREAQESGFTMFSGSYAFTPPARQHAADSGARARLLRLLGLVSRDADTREMEELFKQDTNLSFSLFKLVSTAAFAQTVKVSSFGQAINLLGRRQLQRWLQLLLYARQQDASGALNPLMPHAAFRASMMEVLCQNAGGTREEQDSAFMVGMFSLLDVLFGLPIKDVLHTLQLREEVLEALLQRTGRLGGMLSLAEAADVDKASITSELLVNAGLNEEDYYATVVKAYQWVNQVCQDL